MRNTEDRIRAARLGAENIEKRRLKRNLQGVTAGTALLSLCLILLLSNLLSTTHRTGEEMATTVGFTASIFANPQALNYVIIGLLSFSLGVFVTVLCVLLRRKGEGAQDDD